MDYSILKDIGDFVANHSGWFIAGGVIGGLYVRNKISARNRPVVEGEVVDGKFTNRGDSRLKVRTKSEGDITLVFDTREYQDEGTRISIKIGAGQDYWGRANNLREMLSPGTKIKAKVYQKQGLERDVYELLNLYPSSKSFKEGE